MKHIMEWISVNDYLPVIDKGKHAVSVLCSVHDPIYEECNPGNGSDVQTLIWDGKEFKTIAYGGKGDVVWHQVIDIVTHWMYKPKAFQITDDGFTFDPIGYCSYIPGGK